MPLGKYVRCGRKKLGSGLCSECSSRELMEQRQNRVTSIKANLAASFDDKLQKSIDNRFGMTEASSQDRLTLGKLTRADREKFMNLVAGISTEKFACNVPSQTGAGYERGQMDWIRTMEKGHSNVRFADERAELMNQCYLKAAYKTDVYCGAAIALRAGRNEDAARALEELTMFEEAGHVRKKALHELNTSRNVSVNMNQLLDQVRQGGLALAYKCPSCGGSIRIDKDYNPGMKICGYCGTPLDTSVIASLIQHL
ncbi:MAG TPA: hypothetical protein VGK23_01150 [Methanomassiliicoccales archaeon]